jgi:DNA-binding NarL/FixJ family response regulator
MSIRIVVADDEELVRAGFRMMLDSKPDLDVVGEAADGAEAVEIARRLQPDVVLMDIRMPGMDGIEATRRISELDTGSPIRVIVLTTFDDDEYVYGSLRAGASGFLLKDTPPAELVRAVHEVVEGRSLLSPSVTRKVIERFASAPGADPVLLERVGRLTERETDILKLVAQGLSNAEIGRRLFVSEATVKTHVSRVLFKLEVRDRVQAVAVAYETGLVHPGSLGS